MPEPHDNLLPLCYWEPRIIVAVQDGGQWNVPATGWRAFAAPLKRELMPTVLRVESFRFFFYAGDRDEPPHVHVESAENFAKFWLDPVRLHSSGGFSRTEIAGLHKIVEQNRKH